MVLTYVGHAELVATTVPSMRLSATPSRNRTDYAFAHRVRVRFAETDAMGIVHHSRYLPYLEEARVAYLREIGHPYSENQAAGIDYAVLEQWVQYLEPLQFDDEVDVHLVVVSSSRTTFEIAYLLTVGERVRSVAVTIHGAVTSAGRPTRLPEWLRDLTSLRTNT
jgi:acyl-CoA thioester hydrolase